MGSRSRIVAAVGIALFGGCGHGPGSVHDRDPADKIPAIARAAANGDRSAIPQLIEDLASDDAAVRFYAIDGLKSLTGQDFGYRYYDDDEQRQPAIARWQKWLQEGQRD